MDITAKNEAVRLNLYHLAQLFFHSEGEKFSILCTEKEDTVCVELKKDGFSKKVQARKDPSLHKEEARAANAALGKAFFAATRAFTSYHPPYGILFGVRPVKVPLFYLKNGFSREEVFSLLKNEFFVSDEKARLLLSLAEKENDFRERFSGEDGMLYLSIPFCPSRCRYCSFISSSAPDHLKLIPDYIELLKKDILHTAKVFSSAKKHLRAIYMGGGTPGILNENQMEEVLSLVKKSFDLSFLEEFCVEIGRPDTVSTEKLSVLKEMGVDRISINPQTTNDNTLRRIGRNHTSRDFFDAMALAKNIEFPSINCDLIAGLEGEEPEDFLSSLSDVLEFNPEEITIHALCLKRSATEKNAPSFAPIWQEAMTKAHKTCINEGFAPYYLYRQKNAVADLENTGFSRKEKFGVYNLAMMEDVCDIFACGAGGISKILPKNAGDRILRFAGFKYPYEYLANPDKIENRLHEIELVL